MEEELVHGDFRVLDRETNTEQENNRESGANFLQAVAVLQRILRGRENDYRIFGSGAHALLDETRLTDANSVPNDIDIAVRSPDAFAQLRTILEKSGNIILKNNGETQNVAGERAQKIEGKILFSEKDPSLAVDFELFVDSLVIPERAWKSDLIMRRGVSILSDTDLRKQNERNLLIESGNARMALARAQFLLDRFAQIEGDNQSEEVKDILETLHLSYLDVKRIMRFISETCHNDLRIAKRDPAILEELTTLIMGRTRKGKLAKRLKTLHALGAPGIDVGKNDDDASNSQGTFTEAA